MYREQIFSLLFLAGCKYNDKSMAKDAYILRYSVLKNLYSILIRFNGKEVHLNEKSLNNYSYI